MFRSAIPSRKLALSRVQLGTRPHLKYQDATYKRYASKKTKSAPKQELDELEIEEEDVKSSQGRCRAGPPKVDIGHPRPFNRTKFPPVPKPPKIAVPKHDAESLALLSSIIRPSQSPADRINDQKDAEISSSLADKFKKKKKPKGDKRRINVTSSKLCDDILERLGPSLEEYKGCDIIDINPGAGLFSSKLHDHIQPRSHILMEPDQDVYAQFLDPLLNQPDSKYSSVPESGIVWGHLESVLNKEHLPHQEAYPSGDSRLYQSNKTLLVVANLASHPRQPYKGFGSLGRLVLYQFLTATKASSLFHRYGLVRMLLWVSDEENMTIIPRSMLSRKKAAIELEACCSRATEVASLTGKPDKLRARDPLYDWTNFPRVLKRMAEKRLTVPKGRESLLMEAWGQNSSQELDTYKARTVGLANAKNLRKEAEEKWKYLSEAEARKVYTEYTAARSSLILHYRHMAIRARGQEIQTSIWDLEKDLYNADDSDVKKEIQAQINHLSQELDTLYEENLSVKNITEVATTMDNLRAFRNDLLLWDRREYEPLKVYAEEFTPAKGMALMDLEPRSWPAVQKNYPESDEVLEFLLTNILNQPLTSMKSALFGLWPGAYPWLIQHCPSLTNPNKGGSLDLKQMTARQITLEMLQEIMDAWFDWPFKPTRWDIMAKLGSVHFDPDAEEPDDQMK